MDQELVNQVRTLTICDPGNTLTDTPTGVLYQFLRRLLIPSS